ncbi:uncharacterized protein LOC114250578 [Bombyx mandarina]|uniref:Uncharacterized protein LOC114250578 n=1 Tax=Bombyx mandarina TaxID=7092 RepID=A0A6J2KFC1_BOMMA|nr:uncharacterized protein LOC114250578 [Bombyx mandarina]
MYLTLKQKLLEVPEGTAQQIQMLYGYDERKMNEAVDILEEWLKKQNHFLKKDIPRIYLETNIIGSKGSIERTKSKLDKLFALRTVLRKFYEFNDIRNEFKNLFSCSYILAMPKLTKENNRLFIVKVIGNEFFDKVPYLDYYKIMIAYVEYFRMYDYSDGYRVVIDYRDINIMNIIARLNLVEVKEFFTVILSGYGARLKGIHIISTSKAVENLLRIITPLFNPKLVARFRVHGTLESLHEVISQDRLPKELGGTGRSLKEIQDDWIDLLSSKETSEFFREINKAQVNEAYRMDDLKNEEMGLPGTFRTLSVD